MAEAYLARDLVMTTPIYGNLQASQWNRDPFSKRLGRCYLNLRKGEICGFLACFYDGNSMVYADDADAFMDFADTLDKAQYHSLWVYGATRRDMESLRSLLMNRHSISSYRMLVQGDEERDFNVTLAIRDVKGEIRREEVSRFCRSILKECFGYDPYMPSVVDRMLDRGEEEVYLAGALSDGTFVAQAHIQALSPAYGYIGGVATLPPYQGKGYGRELLLTICRHIHRLGRLPSLTVDPDNERAYQLYVRHGFTDKGPVWVLEPRNY